MSSAKSCRLADFRDVVDEARRFLELPRPKPMISSRHRGSSAAVGIRGIRSATVRHVAADFGHNRGSVFARTRYVGFAQEPEASASIPRCYYRCGSAYSPTETWPAMIAAVTDLEGKITGAHRTWLAPDRGGTRRRSTRRDGQMGHLLRQRRPFRCGLQCLGSAGEGIEDHAVAAMRHADHADGGRALRRTPRRHPASPMHCAGSTSPATTIRLGTARWRALIRSGDRGRARGDSPIATTRVTSTKTSGRSASMRFEAVFAQGAARSGRRRSFSWKLAA